MNSSENNNTQVEIENGQDVDTQKDKHNSKGEYTFENAMELTEIGKFHYKLLVICGLCFISVTTELSGIGTILPVLNCDMTPSLTEVGLLLSAPFLGVVMSSHLVGFFADIYGRVRTLRVTLLISIFFTIVSAFSINMIMLIVCRLLVGFFISGQQACVYTLCGEFHSDRTRARHISLMCTFTSLSNIYVPLLAMFLLPIPLNFNIFGLSFVTWRLFILVNSLLTILAFIGMCTLPETPKYSLVRGDSSQALDCLKTIFVENTGKSVDNYPVKSIILQDNGTTCCSMAGFFSTICKQTLEMFLKGRLWNTLNLCLFMFVLNGIIQGLFNWLPTIFNVIISNASNEHQTICSILSHVNTTKPETVHYSHEQCGSSIDVVLYYSLIFVGCMLTMSYLLFAWVINVVGKKKLLVIWLSVVSALLAAIHFITELHVGMFLLTLIVNAGACASIVSTLTVEYFPANINAMSMSVVIMISRFGAVAGSNVIGQVIFHHCETTIWSMFGVFVLLTSLGYLLPERQNPKKINDQ